jgi:hypothetical protein
MGKLFTPRIALFMAMLFAFPYFSVQAQSLWNDVAEEAFASGRISQQREIIPLKYRTLRLDESQMQSLLKSQPSKNGRDGAIFSLDLPMADGSLRRFNVFESLVMHPDLAAKFPTIKTYSGYAADNTSITLKADFTEKGFHAMILDPIGDDVFIDPYSKDARGYYISYFKKDFVKQMPQKFCGTDLLPSNMEKQKMEAETARLGSSSRTLDRNLRTYRTAVACTFEYAQFHGGTKAGAMSAIVTTMNRVNGVYQNEVAVKLQLIANNDAIVYTTSNDPYSNNDGGTMLSQNQSTIDQVIGSSNYDIGHVFSTGGGGVAFLGCVCNSGNKAGGVTGQSNPVGDPFDIDYVAHEMGHQFGGNHTFNNSCGGNRNTNTAYEVGSGVTIMAYAGICPPNVANNSDAAFHAISLQEISNFVASGGGNSCPAKVILPNNIPTVNAGSDYTIPRGTPFTLTGTSSDVEGTGTHTYSWEQMDREIATQPPSPSSTNGPAFRTFMPTSSPSRTFPRMQDIVNNVSPQFEVLATVGRIYNFRLVVRDNHPGGGFNNYDEARVTVSGTAGPFLVTAPNTAVTWAAGSSQTVTWNVAGSNVSPVNAANVDILLSTNGGLTYPVTIASNVPNNGSATITVPSATTTQARIMVKGSNHIFFDISNANFTITGGGTCTATVPTGLSVSGVTTNAATLSWNAVTGATYDVQYRVVGTTGWTTVTSSTTSTSLTGLAASTQYEAQVRSKCPNSTTSAWSASVNFTTTSVPTCTATVPTGLAASGIGTSSAILSWNPVAGTTYDVQYRQGTGAWVTVSSSTTSVSLSGLTANTTYESQVRSKCPNSTTSAWSASITFTTLNSLNYCAAKGNTTADEYIQRVALGSINNDSGNNNGYGNFTSLSTNLAKGSSNTITIIPRWTGTVYSEAYRVWIDYNQNGTFDAAELVYSRTSTTASTITGTFTVPSSALNGSTRLRVIMRYAQLPTPCGNFTYGEVEDYTVNITGPSARFVSQEQETENEVQIHSYPNPVSNELNVAVTLAGENENLKITMINQQGVEVFSKREVVSGSQFDLSVPVAGFTKGLYLVRIKTKNKTIEKKIVIE